jgi:hypothetical protein
MSSLLVFDIVFRLKIQSVMLVFSTQPCELFIAPLTFSLVHLPFPTPPPSHVQTVCGWEGVGVLSCVGDHILQKVNTWFLTRFRTYKIATPPQTKI